MFTIVLVGLLAAVGPEDPADSPGRLFAQFRENRDKFRTLEVQWRRDPKHTDDWRLSLTKRLSSVEAEFAKLETTDSEVYRRLQVEQQGLRTQLAQFRGSIGTFHTFLGDGKRFMMRHAPPNWGLTHTDEDWLMPDEPVTPETMARDYSGFTFQSYQGDPNLGFRVWTLVAGGNPGTGAVYRNLQDIYAANFFPPLVTLPSLPGKLPWHPIDLLFAANPGEFRTMGRTVIDGTEVVIVERRSQTVQEPSPLKSQVGGRLRQDQVERAFLDPARGALPVRIEWDSELFVDGKPLPRPRGYRPHRVLEVTKIVKVPEAGFYPTEGREILYGDDPKVEGPGNTPEGLIAGNLFEIPSVAFEETSWQAAKVRANAPLRETFALKFPENAYYYSEIDGYSGRVGDEHRDGSALPWSLCAVIVAGWAVYGIAGAVRHRRAWSRSRIRPSAA